MHGCLVLEAETPADRSIVSWCLWNQMGPQAKSQALTVQSRHPRSCVCSKPPHMPAPQGASLCGKECSIPNMHVVNSISFSELPDRAVNASIVPQRGGPKMPCFLPYNLPSFPQAVLGAVQPPSQYKEQKLLPSWYDSLASHFPASDTS